MKNRSRPFHCPIAGKTVGIALRHGGGLQEPANVYVRCDERDCQYVDLNVPPCPLRIDMFADGSDRKTAEYLTDRAGQRVCYSCLTDELGITHEQVRRASWRLKDHAGFSIRPARCVVCNRRRVTITLDGAGAPSPQPAPSSPQLRQPAHPDLVERLSRYLGEHRAFAFCAHCLARELGAAPGDVRETMFSLEDETVFRVSTGPCVSCRLARRVIRYEDRTQDEAPRRVIGFLVEMAGAPFCATCLSFSADLALAETRRLLQSLAGVSEFPRADAVCEGCGRQQMTVSFRGADAHDAQRMGAVEEALSGHVWHRGLRIDLLSFRTAEGWHPFALVRTGAGARIPHAPAIVLGIVRTKGEADELAVVHAREWLDKWMP
jgi:hypothetical protein